MKDFRESLKIQEQGIKNTLAEMRVAEKQTADFLKRCAKAGYTKISVGKRTKENNGWPFGTQGSVWGFPEEHRIDDWPAIWKITKDMNISQGAGNGHQHQVGNENLMEGVYELKNGYWLRTD